MRFWQNSCAIPPKTHSLRSLYILLVCLPSCIFPSTLFVVRAISLTSFQAPHLRPAIILPHPVVATTERLPDEPLANTLSSVTLFLPIVSNEVSQPPTNEILISGRLVYCPFFFPMLRPKSPLQPCRFSAQMFYFVTTTVATSSRWRR